MDDFTREWYSEHLAAASENALSEYVREAQIDKQEQIRFIWLRSFDNPVIVRFDRDGDSGWSFVAKRLSGNGGYSPGEIAEELERTLTEAEAVELERLVHDRRLMRMRAGECITGGDGAMWIAERLDNYGYDYVERWSPTDGKMRDFGEFVIELTGWQIGEIY
ncbi:hypothetical protein AAW01_06285 [Aurantiacibacter gangjinensis]|uniref:Uncharacterized protein n=2 Tax=Aurantiacibacter gangjinensis TaxID=502682 RepID=A0A0G9MW53_9SPHN|nr:hypothetical protein AAW01_06285 [Aurantiacibacter gangjinensis]